MIDLFVQKNQLNNNEPVILMHLINNDLLEKQIDDILNIYITGFKGNFDNYLMSNYPDHF